ncbi:hypothetical protein PEC18_04740 [Paucibacter sp. O1-1]|nr:hypothetical protein [Paucibacter sp. O1-1]MDA3825178.1 hypothetical protein [Paucibacter sp. O1-1]
MQEDVKRSIIKKLQFHSEMEYCMVAIITTWQQAGCIKKHGHTYHVSGILSGREKIDSMPSPNLSYHGKKTIAMREETRIQEKMLNEWSPRPKDHLSGWTLSTDSLEEISSLSPEATLKVFSSAWHKGNYGEMGKQSLYYAERTVPKRAGEIRECMEGIVLHDAEITEIDDEASYETNIMCRLTLNVLGHDLTDLFVFRVQYVDKENLPVVRGHKFGGWQVVLNYIGHAYDLKNKVRDSSENDSLGE